MIPGDLSGTIPEHFVLPSSLYEEDD